MGSLVLAAQAFKELRDRFPEARITALTFLENEEVMRWIDCADEVLAVRRHNAFLFAMDVVRILWILGRRGVDLAMDFEFATRFTALLSFLTLSKERIGFSFPRRPRDRLFTSTVPFDEMVHVKDNFLALVRHAGTRPTTPWSPSAFDEKTLRETKALLRFPSDSSGPCLCVNPNVGELTLARRWPLESFASLCQRLLACGTRLVLIGGPQDSSYVRRLRETLPRNASAINLAGKTDFLHLACLLSLCDGLVSSDSGPIHLAWALSVPTISFFGPESPRLYGPASGPRRILYRNLSCSPCIRAENTKNIPACPSRQDCVRGITVDEAFEATQSLMEEIER